MRNRLTPVDRSLCLYLLTAAIFLGSVVRGVCLPEWLADDTWLGEHPFDQVKLSLAPEFYYWYEDIHGKAFDIESGFRIAFEASYKEPVESGWLWADRVKLYGGSVLYNGGTQNLVTGQVTPLKSTTDYYGALIEARYGYRCGLGENYFLDFMGGVSVEYWDRHLNGGGGEDEYWLPVTLKAGVDLSPRSLGFIASAGLKVPVYTYEESHGEAFGEGTVSFNPQPMISGYAELGYQFTRHFSVSGFFDSYWFRRSNTEQTSQQIGNFIITGRAYQPESISYESGMKANWTF